MLNKLDQIFASNTDEINIQTRFKLWGQGMNIYFKLEISFKD